MKYLFIAFLFISSFTYGQGIEPSSFQPTPYLGGVLRGVTPFVDEFTGQTYYLYVHDSLDAETPYVDTIFMTDFNLYYIKNGDTIYVGSVTDSSFIYNVVSDTFALDMDIDSTNELQELFHQDNILVLTGAGPDSQVDLTTYMNVDTIYMNDYDLWYYNLLESEPYFIGNVTDSSYIKQVVSDSSIVVENDYGTIIVESPANTFGVTVDSTKFATPYALTQINFIDSTNVLNSYGTTITESPANTFNIKVDSSLYATTYDMTLKENYITPGTTSQYWRGDKTWQTTPTGTVTGTGANTQAAYFTSTNNLASNNQLTYNGGYWNMIGRFNLSQTGSNYSVCIGDGSGNVGTSTGIDNFWLGRMAGRVNTSGYYNSAMGVNALYSNTTGYNNVAVGKNSLFSNVDGYSNLGIGESALISNGSGYHNVALGTALVNNTSGFNNIGVGNQSLNANSNGNGNIGLGWRSIYNNSTGNYNVGLGEFSLYQVTGSYNIGLGFQAGFGETGSNKLYITNNNGTTSGIFGDLATGLYGVNQAPSAMSRTWDINGELRVRDLTTTTPTKIMSADADGVVSSLGLSGLSISGGNLTNSFNGDITAVTVSAPVTGGGTSGSVNIAVDTTDATSAALATQFDLLGKQATLVSGTNIKTVNSNSLVGSGDVSVGTVQSITVNAPLTTTQAPITTTATLGVDTTASTGSALATQFDISTKVSGSGTDNYIPRFNGTTAIENSIIYDDGTKIGIGNTSPSRTLHVTGEARITDLTTDITPTVIIGADANGVLESLALSNLSIPGGTTLKGTGFRVNGTGSFNSGDLNLAYGMSGTYPTWAYSSGDFTFRLPSGSFGQVLKHDGTGWAAGTDTGVSDGDKGDITVSSSGAVWNIDTGVVGTNEIATDGVGAAEIIDGSVGASELASTTVTAGSYTNTNLTVDADGRITSASSGSGISDGDKGDITVSGSGSIWNIDSGVVGQPEIATNGVSSDELASNSVASVEIVDGAVALADLAAIPANRVIGSSTGSANAYLSIGTGLEIQSSAITNLATNYGYLFSNTGGYSSFTVSSSWDKVTFNDQMQGLQMTCSTANEQITVTNTGGYEIDYGVCVVNNAGVKTYELQVYNGSSNVLGTYKKMILGASESGCFSGTHVMALSGGDIISLRIACNAGSEVVTLNGPQLKVTRIY